MSQLQIGKISTSHGLKGEVKVIPWCDDAADFLSFKKVTVKGIAFNIESARVQKKAVILKLEGIDNIDAALKLRDEILYIDKNLLKKLPPDTFYVADIIGLRVFEGEEFIGRVDECFATGSNDVYVVRKETGGELLIPAISDVVKKIDIKGQRIDINMRMYE